MGDRAQGHDSKVSAGPRQNYRPPEIRGKMTVQCGKTDAPSQAKRRSRRANVRGRVKIAGILE
jgi:hypothetical protein